MCVKMYYEGGIQIMWLKIDEGVFRMQNNEWKEILIEYYLSLNPMLD